MSTPIDSAGRVQQGGGFVRKSVKLSPGPTEYLVAGEGPDAVFLSRLDGPPPGPVALRMTQKFRVWIPLLSLNEDAAGAGSPPTSFGTAALIAEFVDQLIARPCEVVGNSTGARVAAWFAILYPAKVAQLVLMAPAGFQPADALTQPGTGQIRDEALIARLAEIQAYTLILAGSRDERVPARAVQTVKSGIRRSQLLYVYDASHGLDADQPERVAALVEDFFVRGDAFIVNAGAPAAQMPA